MLMTSMAVSCSKDDDVKDSSSIKGTWIYEQIKEDDSSISTTRIVLAFNSDHTGKIIQEWSSETKSSLSSTMNFSWSTTSDSNGRDILRVSYVSGDKNTSIFPGVVDNKDNVALWTREYVVTGKILNLYHGDGVWRFNKK